MHIKRSALLIVFLLGSLLGILLTQGTRLIGRTPDFPQPVQAAGAVSTGYEKAIISAVRSVGPSVVSVQTRELVRGFFEAEEREGLGTGVIVSADGYILTNNHVIAGAEQIIVKLEDGRQFRARSLGGDPRIDLAVIKIDARNLKPAVTADSSRLEVGQLVIAIGNPLGFERTVNTGIISATKRALGNHPNQPELENLIQTDATINPGNSGGPMVDSAGRVIGINTAVVGGAPGGGMGFAVPINYAQRVLADVKTLGRVRRLPRLGIRVYDIPPGYTGLPQGVAVDVQPGGPAWRGKLRPYDIITRIDNQPVRNSGDYWRLMRNKNAGDTIRLTVYRADDETTFNATVQLEESPG